MTPSIFIRETAPPACPTIFLNLPLEHVPKQSPQAQARLPLIAVYSYAAAATALPPHTTRAAFKYAGRSRLSSWQRRCISSEGSRVNYLKIRFKN
jgi:hypothetical protein